jgi:hypothetical protein
MRRRMAGPQRAPRIQPGMPASLLAVDALQGAAATATISDAVRHCAFSIEHRAVVSVPQFPGGDRRGVTPVPIPNTEVKLSTADGTAGVTLWESRSPPGVFPQPASAEALAGFFFSSRFSHQRIARRHERRPRR